MRNFAYSLEVLLPQWLENTNMKWIQWVYALWQIIRCNPLTLIALSFLPFYLKRMKKKKAVVVLGASKEYDMSVDELKCYLSYNTLKNLEVIKKTNYWYSVKYNGYYYITHQNTLCELARCSKLFGDIDNIIFVERFLPITGTLSVGKMLSQREAYERILSKRYHCSRGSDYVVPTWLDYVDISSKLWVVLSTIPLLLQASGYERFSNLLSLLVILLDLNRGWLYNIYDNLLDRLTKSVKLHIFKERSALYNFFSIFSNRWRYCDTVKKHAYMAKPGDRLKLRCYSKLKSLKDIEIVGWEQHKTDPNDQHICMEIVKDRAHCSLMQYNDVYAVVVLGRPIYVSDHNLVSHLRNTNTARH